VAGRLAHDRSHVAIVGAGAAGLATAIFAARTNRDPSIVLLDGAKKPGAKILVSGGSRCNVTNVVVTEHDFWGGRSTIVRRILRALPVDRTIAFFHELGVSLHEEERGKLFPDSNRSRDVLNALLTEVQRLGITLLSDHRVSDVARDAHGFRVATSHGEIRADRVVLATGGLSLPKTGSDGTGLAIAKRLGHTIVDTTPALAPLTLSADGWHRRLSGVSHDAELAIWIDGAVATRLRGALLWTHFGVSGPVALDASRHWMRAQVEGRRVELTLNCCPGRSFDGVDAEWTEGRRKHPRLSVQSMIAQQVPASVAAALVDALSLDADVALAHFARDDQRRLVHALVAWPLPVTGTRGYNFAEATAGGVTLTEIDPATMASRIVDGLFLVGEMLDVDGRIGGFNFQWAWCTGLVAGRAVVRGAARA
jgi:predicted Rossmann fold flavoprotein